MTSSFARERAHWGKATLIEPVTEYPHVTQIDRLFSVEFRFSAQGETRALLAPMQVELSGFGEILRIRVERLSQYVPVEFIAETQAIIAAAKKSPVQLAYAGDVLVLTLIADTAKRERRIDGILMFSQGPKLDAVVLPLR